MSSDSATYVVRSARNAITSSTVCFVNFPHLDVTQYDFQNGQIHQIGLCKMYASVRFIEGFVQLKQQGDYLDRPWTDVHLKEVSVLERAACTSSTTGAYNRKCFKKNSRVDHCCLNRFDLEVKADEREDETFEILHQIVKTFETISIIALVNIGQRSNF